MCSDYFTYLSVRQKTQALSFLYELLVHREATSSRQAAALIGQIIARFHLVYRKGLPADVPSDPAAEVPFTLWEQYLDRIIYPDHKTTQQQRSHQLHPEAGGGLHAGHARSADVPRFIGVLLRYFRDPEGGTRTPPLLCWTRCAICRPNTMKMGSGSS